MPPTEAPTDDHQNPADIDEADVVDGGDEEFLAAVAGADLDELAGWVHGCLAAGVDPATGARIDR